MDSKELDSRSAELGRRSAETEGIVLGIRLDVLKAIIADVESSKDLAEAFGGNASKKLMMVPTLNDLQIVEYAPEKLTLEQRKKLVVELRRIKGKHVPYI